MDRRGRPSLVIYKLFAFPLWPRFGGAFLLAQRPVQVTLAATTHWLVRLAADKLIRRNVPQQHSGRQHTVAALEPVEYTAGDRNGVFVQELYSGHDGVDVLVGLGGKRLLGGNLGLALLSGNSQCYLVLLTAQFGEGLVQEFGGAAS